MELIDFTRPTKIKYDDLCVLFHTNPIKGNSKADNKARKFQVDEMRSKYSGEIKYNEKKRTYTIIPSLNKHELRAQKIKDNAKDNNLLITLHSGEEIIATVRDGIALTGFKDYILYMANHFKGNTKAQFYLMCLHPIAFYNRIFNNYYPHDDIDGFTYLVQKSMYPPDVLKAGRDLIFKRLGAYITRVIDYWQEQGCIDIFEYYITNENHKLDIDFVKHYTQLALRELHLSSENIALEVDKNKFLETRDKYFQEDIKQGKVEYFKPNQCYLQIIERRFELYSSPEVRQRTASYTQEDLLNILDDFCKVVQARLSNDFKKQKIIIPQEKKRSFKVGYKFEQAICDCYLSYLTLDKESFVLPDIFQQENRFDNYSIYIMKAIEDRSKVNKIIQYRWNLKSKTFGNKKA